MTCGGRCGKALCESESVSRFGKRTVRKNGKAGAVSRERQRLFWVMDAKQPTREPILRQVEALDAVQRDSGPRTSFVVGRDREGEVPRGHFLDASQGWPAAQCGVLQDEIGERQPRQGGRKEERFERSEKGGVEGDERILREEDRRRVLQARR